MRVKRSLGVRERVRRLGYGALAILSLEALISGFYVVITRSLAPIFFAVMGMSLREIVAVNLIAYIAASGIVLLIHNSRKLFIGKRFRFLLVLFHGAERVFWGIIPIVALTMRSMLSLIYTIAVCLTVPTGILINTSILGGLGESDAKRVLAYRSALGAVSSIVGQIVMILTLAFLASELKYIYLYILALAVGLCATILLGLYRLPEPVYIARESGAGEEEVVKASSAFMFLSILLASSAILGTCWSPYLIRELHAADYIAVATGFVYTVVSIVASMFWSSKRYTTYRIAIAGVTAVPIAIALIRTPLAHLAISALFAFTNTGANFLASFIFADIAKRIDVFRASTMLTGAWCLSQVIGLGSAYLAIGIAPFYGFIAAAVLVAIATVIAFITIPEIAVIPSHLTVAYARQLYNISLLSYSFTIFTIKSYVVLTVKLLGLAFILMLLYAIFKLVLLLSTLKVV